MDYVVTVEDYLKLFFDKKFPYSVKSLEFADQYCLEYLRWNELIEYCENNVNMNPDLYALIAQLYVFGKGVEVNKDKGKEFLLKGIDLGSATCMRQLAAMYIDGEIYGSDKESFELLVKAVELGSNIAQNDLAWMYKKGYGCAIDNDKANELFKQSAESGYVIGLYNYGLSLLKSDNLEGIKYIVESAKGGYSSAEFQLGLLYLEGNYFDKNFEKAFYYMQSAAIKGNMFACNRLGHFYRDGIGVIENKELAIYWYEQAIKLGYSHATSYIAEILNNNSLSESTDDE